MKWPTRAKRCKAILPLNNCVSGLQRLRAIHYRALTQKSLRKAALQEMTKPAVPSEEAQARLRMSYQSVVASVIFFAVLAGEVASGAVYQTNWISCWGSPALWRGWNWTVWRWNNAAWGHSATDPWGRSGWRQIPSIFLSCLILMAKQGFRPQTLTSYACLLLCNSYNIWYHIT